LAGWTNNTSATLIHIIRHDEKKITMNNITTQINIYNKKGGTSLFQTTDIETINFVLKKGHPNASKELFVGAVFDLRIEGSENKYKRWKVVGIDIIISDGEINLPIEIAQQQYQGNINAHNLQLIVDVEEFSE
jgi:hypothetical protein